MGGSVASAELRTESARVHVYTYRFERPSSHTRRPGRDLLTLFAERAPGAAGFFRSAGAVSPLLPLGELMIVPAGAAISATGPGGDRRLAVCTMTRGLLPSEFDSDDRRHLAMCCDIADAHVRGGMRRLAAEAEHPGFASDLLIDALAATLKVDLARYFAFTARSRGSGARGALAPWQVRRVEDYVRASEDKRVRVADLARVADMSAGHLARAFKASTGRTVHRFVEEVRVERARALLAEGALPLGQIARRLGFGTPSSFSLAFRRATGVTPGRYRREIG